MLWKQNIVAVLDTMWGDTAGRAPRFFTINPRNHSGRRLYKLVGPDVRLLVTNACPQQVTNAQHHSKPDAVWLAQNIAYARKHYSPALILVCGKVAKQTFEAAGINSQTPVMYMPHPAARSWSRGRLASFQAAIQRKVLAHIQSQFADDRRDR